MSSYRVSAPPSHELSRVYLSVAALVAAAVMALGLPGLAGVDVVVEGQTVTVSRGASVSDLVEAGIVVPRSGDVIGDGGRVVIYGGGESGRVLLNGREARMQTRLATGDIVDVVEGEDIVEEHVVSVEPIEIPLEYEGQGPLVALASPGVVGVREVTRGALSGLKVSSTVVAEAEPMVLRRYKPDAGDRVVALTFDDGPWPLHTQQVLEILEREDAKATFFVLGKQVRKNRAMVQRMVEEGHQVGNHSLSHVYLRGASPELARSEIENAQAEIEKTIGERPGWYRPAGGIVSPAVWTQTRESKVRLITWTVDPQDYRCESPVVLANRVIDSVEPGSVILLHDGGGDRTVTVKALTTIIRELKDRGYGFVTLDELYE